MPEGSEVKLSCDIIKPLIQNHIIKNSYSTSNGRYAGNSPEGHVKFNDALKQGDCKVSDIQVKGKFMYWTFSNGFYLFSTYGMTGQWSPKLGKHPCFVFEHAIDQQSETQQLVFNDPRHFGTIKFTDKKSDLITKLNDLGWDPLSRDFDTVYQNYIVNTVKSKTKCISEVLMDQAIFAGVGNYIKSESLYESNISPWRKCNTLTRDEIIKLCHCIINVMKESYKHQGATLATYKTPYGEEGRYSSFFKVYGKNTDPLGNKIISETTPDKRTTHWVPNLQK